MCVCVFLLSDNGELWTEVGWRGFREESGANCTAGRDRSAPERPDGPASLAVEGGDSTAPERAVGPASSASPLGFSRMSVEGEVLEPALASLLCLCSPILVT